MVVRIADCFLAGLGLIILFPLFCLISLILLKEGRPIMFSQVRVGRNGRPFRLLKFRSMYPNCGGKEITASDDDRVTPIGRLLRRYKLDELPQLWNVIKGDMSILGPRPEIPAFVNPQNPLWVSVLRVRPGITSLASLLFRDEECVLALAGNQEEYYRSVLLPLKLRLEAEYLTKRNAWTDLKLVLLTLRYSFFPRGFDRDRIYRSLHEGHLQRAHREAIVLPSTKEPS
jgi:lipopolysaccharide/colanic/teichoic acid biosynthesis glycosyltransferase